MRPVILVVDDQPLVQRSMRLGLEMSGYEVVTAADGVEALAVLEQESIDLVLADIAMPRLNGYQFYERLRANSRWSLIPFVFVSARALDSDVRYGKALGVDDYLVKPFELEDLLAVVQGRLRRASELAQVIGGTRTQPSPGKARPRTESDSVVVGKLRISPKQHRVWHAGKQVHLSPREFAFLEYLARRPGEAITLRELCRVTHGIDTSVVEAGNLLYSLVRSLRRRLGAAAGDAGCIESVRGFGYRLAAPSAED